MEENPLDTKQRTRILSEIPLAELRPWLAQIERIATIQVVKSPKIGLLMMRATESVEQAIFNVGEVLVADCTVMIDGQLGYGVMIEHDLERVRALAVFDAVFHTTHSQWDDLKRQIEAWLLENEHRQHESWCREFAKIERSLVKFDLLEEVENGE